MWHRRAQAFATRGRWRQAADCYEESLRLRPGVPGVIEGLGTALRRLHRWQEAIDCYRTLRRLHPVRLVVHRHLSEAYVHVGRPRLALQHTEFFLRRKPGDPEARVQRALLRLQQGDFRRGWRDYEWRWRLEENPPRILPRPLWDGSAVAGRTILLHAEQGLGDTLQFVRYAAVLQTAGARVVLESPPALRRLLAGCAGVDRIVPAGETLPPFDVHAPLLSLPRLLGTTPASIPAGRPYLTAEARRVERWRQALAVYPEFRVGIVWQGNPAHPDDHQRSIPLAEFAPLARIPGVRLFSLQQHHGREQIARRGGRFPLVDLGRAADRATGPFVDTAAILQNVDLLITCDSAVAHLAGALGVPVWLALSINPDWRWHLRRADSPWYPTVRIFRQKRPGGWAEVFHRLAAALARHAGRPSSRRPLPIAVSPGELLDKISILEIKRRRIREPAKRRNVRRELAALRAARQELSASPGLDRFSRELAAVNQQLWDCEHDIRCCELRGDFGAKFIDLARSIYRTNDQRAWLKRRINEYLGSTLVEEKCLPQCRLVS